MGTVIRVTPDNFVRAETDRMFTDLAQVAGGINLWSHSRMPTPVDQQTVIRMNRDTLYSFAVVDISEGAVVTVPDADGRYVSVMVVNEDHYINRVLHDAGDHALSVAEFDTPYVLLAMRVLVDPTNPADVAEAHRIQDGAGITAESARPFVAPSYDAPSQAAVREALLALGRTGTDAARTFGRKDQVDPVRHLIGSAMGWGGLPESEAFYLTVDPGLPVGSYRIVVPENVPVDAFWSLSLYNAQGFFEPNANDACAVNSITAVRDPAGTVTIHLGGPDDGRSNRLPIVAGWNYLVRLYRPHPEVLDGRWTFPSIEPDPS